MTSSEIAVRENGHVAERDVVDGWIAVASDVIKVANLICETDFVPEEYRDNAPAVAAAMLTGRELGIGPMMSLRHVQIVKGVPTLSAEYKRARVLAAGHDFEVEELTTQRCRVRGRRAGTSRWLEAAFTMDDARRAGLVKSKGAWETRPRRMLFARAGSELCDFIFADVVNGLPTAEIVADGAEDDKFSGYAESPGQAAPAEAASGQPPKPAQRTARRRQAPPQDPPPAEPQEAAAPVNPPPRAAGGAQLPPLPGEDEPGDTDYDSPGTVTREQLTAMWATFTSDLGFTKDDKAEARAVCEKITGRKLKGGTTSDLSRNEASACIDTLKMVKTRERLIVLMNDGELPDGDSA